MKDEKRAIRKRDIRLAYLFSWGGMGLFGFAVFLTFVTESVRLLPFLMVPAVAGLFMGTYFLCVRCKCPRCGYGGGGRFDHRFHRMLSTKRDIIVCPRCKGKIDII